MGGVQAFPVVPCCGCCSAVGASGVVVFVCRFCCWAGGGWVCGLLGVGLWGCGVGGKWEKSEARGPERWMDRGTGTVALEGRVKPKI